MIVKKVYINVWLEIKKLAVFSPFIYLFIYFSLLRIILFGAVEWIVAPDNIIFICCCSLFSLVH
jgi:hypothetical protein